MVVTYESEQVIVDLLDSLPAALKGLSWRLVIVDNASRDSTLDLVRANLPDGLVVQMGRNAGYAAAINAGLARSGDAPAVLLLNPDVRLMPGSVDLMIECMRRRGAGIVVPRVVDGTNTLTYTLRREPNIRRSLGDAVLGTRLAGRMPTWGESVTAAEAYLQETCADWATGAAMLVSRDCLDACGTWDESFFLYSEETEFCLRARRLGFQLMLAPQAEAVHLGGESKVSRELYSLLVVNRIRLYRRSHSMVGTIAFWLIAVVREVSRLPFGRSASRAALATLLSRSRMRHVRTRTETLAAKPKCPEI